METSLQFAGRERARALRRTGSWRLFSCDTLFVEENITIRISAEAAHWVRRKAAEESTSVSRLVGLMLERQMRESDSYREAYERFREHRRSSRVSASERMTREEAHERR